MRRMCWLTQLVVLLEVEHMLYHCCCLKCDRPSFRVDTAVEVMTLLDYIGNIDLHILISVPTGGSYYPVSKEYF